MRLVFLSLPFIWLGMVVDIWTTHVLLVVGFSEVNPFMAPLVGCLPVMFFVKAVALSVFFVCFRNVFRVCGVVRLVPVLVLALVMSWVPAVHNLGLFGGV